jgi:prepilin-type N-terminal cleavage/methylation domain-containing protein
MSIMDIYMKEFIKSLKKIFKQKKGFTLIELLVVIGILGILAAALVATIDPFEQLNKAQDANVKNSMVEYLTANIRYYATHNAYPWDTGITGHCTPDPKDTTTNGPQSALLCTGATDPSTGAGCTVQCIAPLVDDSELRPSFVTAIGTLSKIYVSYYGADQGPNTNTLIACFAPKSRSGQRDPLTKYGPGGISTPTDCQSIDPTFTGTCYWCTK